TSQLGRFAPSAAGTQTLDADPAFGGTVSILGLNASPAKIQSGPLGANGFAFVAGSIVQNAPHLCNGGGASAPLLAQLVFSPSPAIGQDMGTADASQLVRSFDLVRGVAPVDTTSAPPSGAADIRVHRVFIQNAKTGVTVTP